MAAHAEAKPLIRRLGMVAVSPGLYRPSGDQNAVHLFCHGIGAAGAQERLEPVLDRLQPARLISSGVAGALRAHLQVAEVRVPEVLIDAATGQRFEPTLAVGGASGILVTASALAGDAEAKTKLRLAHEADLVDMESAAIARVCQRRQIRWACLRAVSDLADEQVPAEFASLVDAHGKPRLGSAIVYALTHPQRIGAMVRLGKNTAAAAEALADHVVAVLEDLGRADQSAGKSV